MPNHCANELEITGDYETLTKIKITLRGRYPSYDPTKPRGDMESLCFDKIIPVPTKVIAAGYDPHDGKLGGYTWQNQHWGSKWGAYDTFRKMKQDPNELKKQGQPATQYVLHYGFNTAWAPMSTELIEKLAQMFPNVTIKLLYDEPGMGFAGKVEAIDGDIVEDTHVEGDDYQDFVINELGYDPIGGDEDAPNDSYEPIEKEGGK